VVGSANLPFLEPRGLPFFDFLGFICEKTKQHKKNKKNKTTQKKQNNTKKTKQHKTTQKNKTTQKIK